MYYPTDGANVLYIDAYPNYRRRQRQSAICIPEKKTEIISHEMSHLIVLPREIVVGKLHITELEVQLPRFCSVLLELRPVMSNPSPPHGMTTVGAQYHQLTCPIPITRTLTAPAVCCVLFNAGSTLLGLLG